MMKKEGLPGIGVAQIGPADGRGYVTDHFLVTDRRWSAPALFAEPVRFYGACTGICTAGSCTISLNLKISEIRPGDLIFIVPGTIVHIPRQSDDFSLCMTGFSAEFLKGIYQAINPLPPRARELPNSRSYRCPSRELCCRRNAARSVRFAVRESAAQGALLL